MKALFLLWRALLLCVIAWGLTRSGSAAASLFLCFGFVYRACDIVLVLASARRRA